MFEEPKAYMTALILHPVIRLEPKTYATKKHVFPKKGDNALVDKSAYWLSALSDAELRPDIFMVGNYFALIERLVESQIEIIVDHELDVSRPLSEIAPLAGGLIVEYDDDDVFPYFFEPQGDSAIKSFLDWTRLRTLDEGSERQLTPNYRLSATRRNEHFMFELLCDELEVKFECKRNELFKELKKCQAILEHLAEKIEGVVKHEEAKNIARTLVFGQNQTLTE